MAIPFVFLHSKEKDWESSLSCLQPEQLKSHNADPRLWRSQTAEEQKYQDRASPEFWSKAQCLCNYLTRRAVGNQEAGAWGSCRTPSRPDYTGMSWVLLEWLLHSCLPNGGRERAFAGGEPGYRVQSQALKYRNCRNLVFPLLKSPAPPATACVKILAFLIASYLTRVEC